MAAFSSDCLLFLARYSLCWRRCFPFYRFADSQLSWILERAIVSQLLAFESLKLGAAKAKVQDVGFSCGSTLIMYFC